MAEKKENFQHSWMEWGWGDLSMKEKVFHLLNFNAP